MRATVQVGLVASAVAALASVPVDAVACPLCNSETAAAVRANLLDRFVPTLLAVAAPFPVLLAIVAALHGSGRR